MTTAQPPTSSASSAPPVRIAVVPALLNAGETTRAVEIAKAVREYAIENNHNVDIHFFATLYSSEADYGFAHTVTNAGFDLDFAGPGLTAEEWKVLDARGKTTNDIFDESQLDFVKTTLTELKRKLEVYQPTVVIHGFNGNMDAPIVSKLLGIPNVSFLPVPLSPKFAIKHLLPFELERKFKYGFQYIPTSVYQSVFTASYSMTKTLPNCQLPTIGRAAQEVGWEPKRRGDLLEANEADLVLVNDLPGNFEDDCLDDNFVVTGPVFPKTDETQVGSIDPETLRVFDPADPRKKIFIAMGSSGHKEKYVEALKAVGTGEFNVVAVVLPTKCSIQDVLLEVGELPPNVYVTDRFVPAKVINRMADLAIIHGGQGTVQTAMSTGKPIIGIAHQTEQNFNLNAVQKRGAGINVADAKFKAPYIRSCVDKILNDPSYTLAAQAVQKEIEECDGFVVCAEKILELALKRISEMEQQQ